MISGSTPKISNVVAKSKVRKRKINRDMDASRFLVIVEHGEYEVYFNKLRAAKDYFITMTDVTEMPVAYCVGRRQVFCVNLFNGKRAHVCRVH